MDYDKFEPVSNPESTDGGYFSTARPSKEPRHTGLVMALSLLIVLLCAIATVVSLYEVRIERSADRMSLTFIDRDPEVSAAPIPSETVTLPEQTTDAPMMQLVQPPAASQSERLTNIYQESLPSVVSVVSTRAMDAETCCGIVLTADGYLITNASTMVDAKTITVLLHDGVEYIASMVGMDTLSDLAVLKIDATGLTPAVFSDGSQLAVGQSVVAIGDSKGVELRGAMTDGIVCAVYRDLSLEGRTMTILQTNATLHAGGYGGPLLDLHGQVVGIHTKRIGYYDSEGTEGLGYAISAATAKGIVDELIQHGSLPGRPSLGIGGQSVPIAAQDYYRLPAGVYIESVEPQGAADVAGLQPGDIITHVEGGNVNGIDELSRMIGRYRSGDVVLFSVFRNGETFDLIVRLGEAK